MSLVVREAEAGTHVRQQAAESTGYFQAALNDVQG